MWWAERLQSAWWGRTHVLRRGGHAGDGAGLAAAALNFVILRRFASEALILFFMTLDDVEAEISARRVLVLD